MKLTCKYCDSEKIRLVDHETLYIPNSPKIGEKPEDENDLYDIDDEIFASAVCGHCGEVISLVGKINWKING